MRTDLGGRAHTSGNDCKYRRGQVAVSIVESDLPQMAEIPYLAVTQMGTNLRRAHVIHKGRLPSRSPARALHPF